MTTLLQALWKSVSSLEDKEISPLMRGYFQGMTQNDAHNVVITVFQHTTKEHDINRAFIARRLNKSPEQITRWLGAPGNWTMDTYTDLLLAMGYKPTFSAEKLTDLQNSNYHHPLASGPQEPLNVTLSLPHATYDLRVSLSPTTSDLKVEI